MTFYFQESQIHNLSQVRPTKQRSISLQMENGRSPCCQPWSLIGFCNQISDKDLLITMFSEHSAGGYHYVFGPYVEKLMHDYK